MKMGVIKTIILVVLSSIILYLLLTKGDKIKQSLKETGAIVKLVTGEDTVQLSIDKTFSATKTIIIAPYSEFTTATYKISDGRNLYIRRLGGDTILIKLGEKLK
jgi:hypothetical protein